MQVYQWDESVSRHPPTNKNGIGSTTTKTYSYTRQWLPTTPPRVNTSFINSGSKFTSKNSRYACWNWDPVVEESSWWSSSGYAFLGTTNIQYSTNVQAGNYIVPDDIIKDFGSPKVLTPSCGGNYSSIITNSSNITTITTNIPGTSPLPCSPGGGGASLRGSNMVRQKVDSNGQSIDYLTRSYTLRTANTISILAQQKRDTFVMWKSSYDNSYVMFILTEGNWTANEMFAVEEANRVGFTWFLRALTLVGVIVGMFLVTMPLTLVLDIIPFIGDFIGDLVGCILWVVDCMLGCCCWSTVVALCWIVYRPNVAIPLFCVAFGLVVLSIIAAIINHRKKKEEDSNSKMDSDAKKQDDDDNDEADIEAAEGEADIEVPEANNPHYVETIQKK